MASTQPSSGPAASSIILASIGTLTAAALAYAVYFDQRRRNDPDFRRQLRRARRQADRAEENAAAQAQKSRFERARDLAISTKHDVRGSPQEDEAQFMELVAEGERLMLDDAADPVDAAFHFFRALKLYPQPGDLMQILDKTLNTQTREVFAEMIAADSSLELPGRRRSADSASGSATVE